MIEQPHRLALDDEYQRWYVGLPSELWYTSTRFSAAGAHEDAQLALELLQLCRSWSPACLPTRRSAESLFLPES